MLSSRNFPVFLVITLTFDVAMYNAKQMVIYHYLTNRDEDSLLRSPVNPIITDIFFLGKWAHRKRFVNKNHGQI